MSSPIIISLYCKGRQKDYEAIFSNHNSVLEFKVMIDDNIVQFEGGVNETFKVKTKEEHSLAQVDAAMLEAVRQQLNQIFF